MQRTSVEYRESMKRPLRERSHIRINMGIMNQEATRCAYVSNSSELLSYSNTDIFSKNAKNRSYATFERDFIQMNGKSYFLPTNLELRKEENCITKGIITSSAPQTIFIKFNTAALDIKGLTIDFGANYPVNFVITSDKRQVVVVDNNGGKYRTDEVFEATTHIKLTASKMLHEQNRLRINNVLFGVGISFENDKIISCSYAAMTNQVNEELPTVDFSFTIENSSREFDIESKDSSINFLETGQEMEVEYGYELNKDNIEWVKGGTFELASWKSNDAQAEFMATDLLVYLDDTYYKGRYYSSGITLYDLAILVLDDAGVSEDDYVIDTYLKKIKVKNPLPVAMHKECLQLIANAGRCTMTINKAGMVSIKSSFLPDYAITSNGEETFSNAALVTNGGSKKQYASLERNVTNLVKTYFLPPAQTSTETGYISKSVSNSECAFSTKPTLTIELESAFYTFGLDILFGELPPTDFTLATYNDNVAVETIIVTGNKDKNYILNYEFLEFNKLVVTFSKTAQPYNRIKVDHIAFGETTNYSLDYNDLAESPTGSQLARIKEVQVTSTTYTKSTALMDISTEEVEVNKDNLTFTFTFDNPCHDISATCEQDYSVYVIEQGAYFCTVKFKTYPSNTTTCKLNIKGYTYRTTCKKFIQNLSLRGETKTWDNPLVSEITHAKDVLEWVSNYMRNDKEYELQYRGEPALEVNDTFFLENKYNESLRCRIYQHTIEYNGALSGSLYARKEAD